MNLENRILELERQVNSQRWLLCGFMAVAAIFYICVFMSPGSLPATRVEAAQAVRAESLTLKELKVSRLELISDEGKSVGTIQARETGVQAYFNGDNGSLGFHTWNEKPTIILLGEHERVELSYDELALRKQDAKATREAADRIKRKAATQKDFEALTSSAAVVRISSTPTGGFVSVSNQFDKLTASLRTGRTNEGELTLCDVDGKPSKTLTARQ